MPMAPYTHIDFGSRIKVIREVGTALGTASASMPAQNAANSDIHCIKWINILNGLNGIPNFYSIDYTKFQSAINALAAKVP